jgi:hypothetical protein
VETINIDDDNKCRVIAGDFHYHADAAIQCGVHCLMELIQVFNRSHCIPPSGECLHRIAPATTKAINIKSNNKTLTKKTFS